jgi:hypothetical protein
MKSPRYSAAALATTMKYCVGAILVCVLLIGFVRARRSAAEQRNALAAQHIQVARERLEHANQYRALVEKYLGPYNRLVREGSLRRFDRAAAGDWFEAAIKGQQDGAVDSYSIGKDAPFAGTEGAELTAFRIISHPLEFAATVPDEDEFAALMTSIASQVPGTTSLEACSLALDRKTGRVEPLAVRCSLVWYEFAPNDGALAVNTAGNQP